MIKVLGRWASDVYMIYCRASRQAAASTSLLIGSTECHDVERGVSTEEMDEILMPGALSIEELLGDE